MPFKVSGFKNQCQKNPTNHKKEGATMPLSLKHIFDLSSTTKIGWTSINMVLMEEPSDT